MRQGRPLLPGPELQPAGGEQLLLPLLLGWRHGGGFGYGGYPSVYGQYGWDPGYIYPSQAYYQPTYYPPDYQGAAPSASYAPESQPLAPQPVCDVEGLNRALDDLHNAWLNGNPDPLRAHLSDQLDVQILFNGTYSYTTKARDYAQMTLDNFSNVKTVSLDFGTPCWISAAQVFVTGRQVFTDPDGVQNTMYLSFMLQQYGTDWYVTAFGSSKQPIESSYHDFRG